MDGSGIVAVLPWRGGLVAGLRRRAALAWSTSNDTGAQSVALAYAAGAGETAALERLLASGVDPNVRDRRGETPLHRAVRRGHAHTAACLLAYGADHTLTDSGGRAALDRSHTSLETLHAVRQQLRRFRTRVKTQASAPSPQVAHWLTELELLGITKIAGLVEPESLARLRSEFGEFVGRLDAKVARGEGCYRHYDEEEHFWEADTAYVCNNAFKYSAELVGVCRNPNVAAVVDAYSGAPPTSRAATPCAIYRCPSAPTTCSAGTTTWKIRA